MQAKLFPTGLGYDLVNNSDDYNITNFSDGKLGDAKP